MEPLQDALEEATSQLADMQDAVASLQAELQSARAREAEAVAAASAEGERAREVIGTLRAEWESVLRDQSSGDGAPRAHAPPRAASASPLRGGGSSQPSSPGGRSSCGLSPGGANPFDRTLRSAIAAQNKAKFEAVKAERNRLKAEAAESELDKGRLHRRIQELEGRLAAAAPPPSVPPPPARLSDAAAASPRVGDSWTFGDGGSTHRART
jgi:hypothetical protein